MRLVLVLPVSDGTTAGGSHKATDGACKGCIWGERWQKASMTAASGLSADGSIGFQMWLLQKKNIMNTAGAEIT